MVFSFLFSSAWYCSVVWIQMEMMATMPLQWYILFRSVIHFRSLFFSVFPFLFFNLWQSLDNLVCVAQSNVYMEREVFAVSAFCDNVNSEFQWWKTIRNERRRRRKDKIKMSTRPWTRNEHKRNPILPNNNGGES